MKSGLHNLDIRWTYNLSCCVQLEVKHFGICILFPDQHSSSVVSVSLKVCGRLCCLWKPLLKITLIYFAKVSCFQAQANSERRAKKPWCRGQMRGTYLWEKKELSWIAEVPQPGFLTRPDLWLCEQLQLMWIAASGTQGPDRKQGAVWRGEGQRIKWESILLSFSSCSVTIRDAAL